MVATRVGGIPEQLGERAGLLIEPQDSEGLAQAVTRLIDGAELRAALGAAGRTRVERLFTLERQADGLDEAYRMALATQAGP